MDENVKEQAATGEAAKPEMPPLVVVVVEHPLTRTMQLDLRGMPNEIAIEVLGRALEYCKRQQLITDLVEKLRGPQIVGADAARGNGGPAGHARRFLGG